MIKEYIKEKISELDEKIVELEAKIAAAKGTKLLLIEVTNVLSNDSPKLDLADPEPEEEQKKYYHPFGKKRWSQSEKDLLMEEYNKLPDTRYSTMVFFDKTMGEKMDRTPQAISKARWMLGIHSSMNFSGEGKWTDD